MLRLISDMLRGSLYSIEFVTLPLVPILVLFLGFGVRNLWKTGGTILRIAAFESLNSELVSLESWKLRKFSWTQTNSPMKISRPVRHRVLPPRLRPRRLRPVLMILHATCNCINNEIKFFLIPNFPYKWSANSK